MEDRQAFTDGLIQLRANAGLDPLIVEKKEDNWYEIYTAPENNSRGVFVAGAYSENVADFIATTHAVIPEMVDVINSALDESDRLDEEKDDLHGQIFNLELERASLGTEVGDLLSKISHLETELEDRDYTITGLIEENDSMEREIDELRGLTLAQAMEIGELRNDLGGANERISELEFEIRGLDEENEGLRWESER